MRKGEERLRTATRGQVQKSNGKVTPRLVRQGNRKALIRQGNERNRKETLWNGVEGNAREEIGKELFWRCVWFLCEGIEKT